MTHCAQAGTLSPRTTEPPVVHKELAEVLANPVIAVVRSAEELAEALTSRVSAIEIRSGDLASLPALIGRDPAAIDFLCGYARPTAIVSTKKQILQKARACGLITIFQIFMIDTQAFETGIQTARRLDCDAVEIMPGAIPHIIREVSSQLPLPVLCAGLVKTEAEIHEVLKAGAQAVATSRRPLWFASSLREVAA